MEQIPVNVVGSSSFGRYPKISVEKTYNMFISDGWLVDFAGFQAISQVPSSATGRGSFVSIRGGFALVVIGSGVYKISSNISVQFIRNINSTFGGVSIDENLNSQIAIADGQELWIYNYVTNEFTLQALLYSPATGSPYNVRPSYVIYHNSFFLIASSSSSTNPQLWYAATPNGTANISIDTADAFPIQTKPDMALALQRIPSKGNNIIVFGDAVAEIWTQVGGAENYRRVQSFNIDQGLVSSETLSSSDQFVCWIGRNEKNTPVLMVSDGAGARQISTDGISYLLETIQFPEQSTAFFFRQDGHLFYQFTFYNEADNLTLAYDFNTEKFYHLSDESMNYHPARKAFYFSNRLFFISLNDAMIYQSSTDFIGYNYSLDAQAMPDNVPRLRVCKTLRKADSSRFRARLITFWIEQGVQNIYDVGSQSQNGRPCVDLTLSYDGGQTFSNAARYWLNPQGKYRNQIRWRRLGLANELTPQFRFHGLQRFVCNDGIAEVF